MSDSRYPLIPSSNDPPLLTGSSDADFDEFSQYIDESAYGPPSGYDFTSNQDQIESDQVVDNNPPQQQLLSSGVIDPQFLFNIDASQQQPQFPDFNLFHNDNFVTSLPLPQFPPFSLFDNNVHQQQLQVPDFQPLHGYDVNLPSRPHMASEEIGDFMQAAEDNNAAYLYPQPAGFTPQLPTNFWQDFDNMKRQQDVPMLDSRTGQQQQGAGFINKYDQQQLHTPAAQNSTPAAVVAAAPISKEEQRRLDRIAHNRAYRTRPDIKARDQAAQKARRAKQKAEKEAAAVDAVLASSSTASPVLRQKGGTAFLKVDDAEDEETEDSDGDDDDDDDDETYGEGRLNSKHARERAKKWRARSPDTVARDAKKQHEKYLRHKKARDANKAAQANQASHTPAAAAAPSSSLGQGLQLQQLDGPYERNAADEYNLSAVEEGNWIDATFQAWSDEWLDAWINMTEPKPAHLSPPYPFPPLPLADREDYWHFIDLSFMGGKPVYSAKQEGVMSKEERRGWTKEQKHEWMKAFRREHTRQRRERDVGYQQKQKEGQKEWRKGKKAEKAEAESEGEDEEMAM